MNNLIKLLDTMKDSKVSNYVIAGLDSYVISSGMVRMFENSREHQDQISPHSHRFDFTCLVLSGHVLNHIWNSTDEHSGDFFEESHIYYTGEIGTHDKSRQGRGYWNRTTARYTQGEFYSMKSDEIHSITFSRGAKVLFFEGPKLSNYSTVLEPVVGGRLIPTMVKRDYMFLKNGG